jgi:hypothetical protein
MAIQNVPMLAAALGLGFVCKHNLRRGKHNLWSAARLLVLCSLYRPVAEEPLRIVLRVLSCFTDRPCRLPDAVDEQQLRESVSGDERNWEVDVLATYVIHQELNRHKVRGAA